MGYRLYLAQMPKKEFKQMLRLTYNEFWEKYTNEDDKKNQIEDGEKYITGIYDITEELFGLGKYVDYSHLMKPVVFKDKNIEKSFNENSFHILKKDILKEIIKEYSDNVVNYYKGLLDGISTHNLWGMELGKVKKTPEERIDDIEQHLMRRIKQYTNGGNYNIEKGPITSSWEYEYEIFELIRIYREFDEKKNVLLYYGF